MVFHEKFIKIFFITLILNGFVVMVDSLIETPIRTPFDGGALNVTATTSDQPLIFNSTDQSGTSFESMNGTLTNSTGGSPSGSLNPADWILYPIQLIMTFVNLITGGFIFQFLTLIGFPDIFIWAMQGIFGFLGLLSLVYFFSGK